MYFQLTFTDMFHELKERAFEYVGRITRDLFLGRDHRTKKVKPREEEVEPEQGKITVEKYDDAIFETVEDILRNTAIAFKHINLPDCNSIVDKGFTRGMQKMGPMVIPDNYDNEWVLKKLDHNNLPAQMYTAANYYDADNEDMTAKKIDLMFPAFFYAVKVAKNRPELAHAPGVVYEGGYIFTASTGEGEGKRVWTPFYFYINDGVAKVIDRMPLEKRVSIKHKSKKYKTHFKRVEWQRQEVVKCFASENHQTYQEALDSLSDVIQKLFTIWSQRQHRWRFSLRKQKKRMTFLIRQTDPKKLFKDRKVSARTATGQKKRIIHYVTDHKRIIRGNEVQVKEHLRGIRRFEWEGNEISILAPDFHDHNIDDFKAEGHLVDEEKTPEGFLEARDFMPLFADMEDGKNSKRVKAFYQTGS